MPDHSFPAQRSQGLVDILDRILDKGLVIAGDIRINLADVELLTIQIRLIVCSVDKADQIGMSWWRNDPYFTGRTEEVRQLSAVSEQLDRIENRLEALERKRVK